MYIAKVESGRGAVCRCVPGCALYVYIGSHHVDRIKPQRRPRQSKNWPKLGKNTVDCVTVTVSFNICIIIINGINTVTIQHRYILRIYGVYTCNNSKLRQMCLFFHEKGNTHSFLHSVSWRYVNNINNTILHKVLNINNDKHSKKW